MKHYFLTKDIKDTIACGINLYYRISKTDSGRITADRIIETIKSAGLTPQVDFNACGYGPCIKIVADKCTLSLSEAEVLAFRLNEVPTHAHIEYRDSSFFLTD